MHVVQRIKELYLQYKKQQGQIFTVVLSKLCNTIQHKTHCSHLVVIKKDRNIVKTLMRFEPMITDVIGRSTTS